MLERTFQHLPGFGRWGEKRLWKEGVATWDDLEKTQSPGPATDMLKASRRALLERNLTFFAQALPPREHWRLFPEFEDQTLFFDIECDEKREITVVTVFDLEGIHLFIRGRNLDGLPKKMAQRRLWVTYNGVAFDVPCLKKEFPELQLPLLHVDLRYLAGKLKLFGGLKSIEKKLGLERPSYLHEISGQTAITLWKAYTTQGDEDALGLLLEYNIYDTMSLPFLLATGVNHSLQRLPVAGPQLPLPSWLKTSERVRTTMAAMGFSENSHAGVIKRLRQSL